MIYNYFFTRKKYFLFLLPSLDSSVHFSFFLKTLLFFLKKKIHFRDGLKTHWQHAENIDAVSSSLRMSACPCNVSSHLARNWLNIFLNADCSCILILVAIERNWSLPIPSTETLLKLMIYIFTDNFTICRCNIWIAFCFFTRQWYVPSSIKSSRLGDFLM